MTRRILLSIIILIVVVCVGLSLILSQEHSYWQAEPGNGTRSDTVYPTRTPVMMPTSTPGSNLPTDVEQQMDQIQVRGDANTRFDLARTTDAGCSIPRTTSRSGDERVFRRIYARRCGTKMSWCTMPGVCWKPEYDIIGLFKELYSANRSPGIMIQNKRDVRGAGRRFLRE
jgi:hypothetical protein